MKYFSPNEFRCRCGCGLGYKDMHPELLGILDELREHLGRPIIITSAIRCNAHNANVGGTRHSQHKKGTAVDIKVEGLASASVSGILSEWFPDSCGIGTYPSFTHFDIRQIKARW